MTFILTAVCVDPRRAPGARHGRLLVRPVPNDGQAPFRAGFATTLGRYLPVPVDGSAYYIVTDEGAGYETSNVFASYPAGEDDPIRLMIPRDLHQAFENCLTDLLAASLTGRVILIFEFNGNVTAPEESPEQELSIDLVGPMPVNEFWWRLELGEFVEDSIIQVECG